MLLYLKFFLKWYHLSNPDIMKQHSCKRYAKLWQINKWLQVCLQADCSGKVMSDYLFIFWKINFRKYIDSNINQSDFFYVLVLIWISWPFKNISLIISRANQIGGSENRRSWRKTTWAASWQNQQNGMCAQLRLRSAWASTQLLRVFAVRMK